MTRPIRSTSPAIVIAAALALGAPLALAPARADDGAPAGGSARMGEIARLEDGRDPAAVPLLVEWVRDAELLPAVRARSARALGRLKSVLAKAGDPIQSSALEVLSEVAANDLPGDAPGARVRHEAIFALGQIASDHPASREALYAARAAKDDARARALAAEATGKLGKPEMVPALAALLGDDPSPRARAMAAVGLGRLGAPGAVEPLLEAIATEKDTATRELVAWAIDASLRALARVPAPPPAKEGEKPDPDAEAARRHAEAVEAMKAARDAIIGTPRLFDESARVRATLHRALYRLPEEHLPAPASARLGLAPAEVAAWNVALVRRQGLRAAKRNDGDGLARVVGSLIADARHRSFHVRRSALAALGEVVATTGTVWEWSSATGVTEPGPKTILAAVRAALRDPRRTVRAAALVALARLDPRAGEAAARERLSETDPIVRAGAVSALAIALGKEAPDALGKLFGRLDARARLACVDALAGLDDEVKATPAARALARRALAVDDLAVRGTAVALVAAVTEPEDARAEAVASLGDALAASSGRAFYEVREDIVRSLGTMNDQGAVPILETALADPMESVRDLAAGSLETLTGKRPAPRKPRAAAEAEVRMAEARTPDGVLAEALPPDPAGAPLPRGTSLVLVTERGKVRIELFTADAAIHARNVVSLARRGFYDGRTIHRVVTDFVVQGGCPRGDGWGDPGYTLRDEINPRYYERGVLGMPKAGDDTGGCQLFVMHSWHPHLDGRYTAFGAVTEGLAVIDELEEGDRIFSVRVEREGRTDR